MTYMHQGRQFVVVGVRGPTGSGAQLMAFALPREEPAGRGGGAVDVVVRLVDERRSCAGELSTLHAKRFAKGGVCRADSSCFRRDGPTFARSATAGQPSPVIGAKAGGSAWESNPAFPQSGEQTGFEDREGHRAPFASVSR